MGFYVIGSQFIAFLDAFFCGNIPFIFRDIVIDKEDLRIENVWLHELPMQNGKFYIRSCGLNSSIFAMTKFIYLFCSLAHLHTCTHAQRTRIRMECLFVPRKLLLMRFFLIPENGSTKRTKKSTQVHKSQPKCGNQQSNRQPFLKLKREWSLWMLDIACFILHKKYLSKNE